MKKKKKSRKYGIKNFAKRTVKELGIGDRRSSVPLDNTTQTIHNSCKASSKPSTQLTDFLSVGKIKTEQAMDA